MFVSVNKYAASAGVSNLSGLESFYLEIVSDPTSRGLGLRTAPVSDASLKFEFLTHQLQIRIL